MINKTPTQAPPFQGLLKFAALGGGVALCGWFARYSGIASDTLQLLTLCTFATVIGTTLFFWTHRVAVALLGVALLIGARAMTLQGVIRSAELDIILFLLGMMIIVGALKDLGFLTWVVQSIINRKHMSGAAFALIVCGLSASLSCVVNEVSAIVVVLTLVFQVCDTLKVRATPFVLIAVLCANIGSSATMLGNPVGLYVGYKAGFTFGQFFAGAAPVALLCLAAAAALLLFWYGRDIRVMTAAIREHHKRHEGLGPLVRVPFRRGLFVLIATVLAVAFHHQIETALGLTGVENRNAFLIVTPLVVAGLLMAYRPDRARHYVEHDVEWWTLLFFMLLFAIAGGLSEQGVTRNLADKLGALAKSCPTALLPFVIALSAIGSAIVDNIVFVAAFTPVVQTLSERAAEHANLWWALLFGACFGGNITAVGSAANIVALGLLERREGAHIGFVEWLKVGGAVGALTSLLAWGLLSLLPMPHPAAMAGEAPPLVPAVEQHLSPSPSK